MKKLSIEDIINQIKENSAQNTESAKESNILKSLSQAIKTVSQFKDVEKAIDEHYDEKPVNISSDTAKAMLIFMEVVAKKYNTKNPILLFDALKRSEHEFKGALNPLNDLGLNEFSEILLKSFEIEEDSVAVAKSEDEVSKESYQVGDIVKYKSTGEYGYVESVIETAIQVWSKGSLKWVAFSEIKLIENNDEKLIAEILMNWDLGMKIYCYDKEGDEVARFMVVAGEEDSEYRIMNAENYSIIPSSNTNSKYNIAYFIVRNIQPASIEIL